MAIKTVSVRVRNTPEITIDSITYDTNIIVKNSEQHSQRVSGVNYQIVQNRTVENEKFITNIGNGIANTITINHNLNGDTLVVVVKNNSSNTIVYPEIIHPNTNYTIINFDTIPTANQYNIIVAKI